MLPHGHCGSRAARIRVKIARRSQNTNLYWQAQATAHLDDYPHALDLLESHFAVHKLESLESLLFDECWDPVHDDPRFVALLKLTGLRK